MPHTDVTGVAVSGQQEESDTLSVADYSTRLAYLINEVYRPRIEEDVDFGVLLSYMPSMSKILPQVYQLMKTSRKEAAKVFFKYLKDIEDDGKYQSLLEALRRAKYPILVAALETDDTDACNDHEYKQLISIFFNDIADTIDAERMSQDLQEKEIITAEEGEQIRNISRHYDNKSASFDLLLKIHRRAPGWYEGFIHLLFDHHHYKLVGVIDPKMYEKLMCEKNHNPSSAMEMPEDLVLHATVNKDSQSGHGVLSVSADTHSVPRLQPKAVVSEFNERVLDELVELKALVNKQIQCLQTVLVETELLVGRVERLERKLTNESV